MPPALPRRPGPAIAAFILTVAALGSAADAPPQATRVRVRKASHTLELLRGDEVIRSYKAAIGPGGAGPKRREGDAVTPVGRYHVVGRGPSVFTIFLRLDYPNAADRARFARLQAEGALPKDARIGGDIGIHGSPPRPEHKAGHKDVDWTLGCVAVDDDEIRTIARAVPDGTIVDIED